MKKILLISMICISIILAFSLVGIGGEKKLSVLLEDTPWHRNIEKTINEFEKSSGINVTLEFMPEAQSREKLDLDLTLGTGVYDVFLADEMYIQKFAKLGALFPLDDFVNNDKEFEKTDFPEPALRTVSFDGKLYGIPWRSAPNIMLYRKDLLQKYNVKVPQTMDELMSAAITIRQGLVKDGEKDVYGITLRGLRGEGLNMWIIGSSFLPAWGAKWMDDSGKPQVNSPEFVDAIKFYATILQKAGSPDAASQSWDDCYRIFETGKAAFFIDSAIQASLIYDAKGPYADKIGVALVPKGPIGTYHTGLYCPSYVMTAKTEDKDTAWEFMKWATSAKQMLSDAVDGGNYEIARITTFKDDRFKKRFPYEDLINITIESKKTATEERPMIIGWPEIGDIVSEVAQRVIAGSVDAETGLDEAQKRLMGIYNEDPNNFK